MKNIASPSIARLIKIRVRVLREADPGFCGSQSGSASLVALPLCHREVRHRVTPSLATEHLVTRS